MKKLIMLVLALALVAAFMPKAYAGDSAQLNLSVTFAQNEPLILTVEPLGPYYIMAGMELRITVRAEDKDAEWVNLEALDMPEGANFYIALPDMRPFTHCVGSFVWTPTEKQAGEHVVRFTAKSSNSEVMQGYDAKINVARPLVVAIELNNSSWQLDAVKLGEKRVNLNDLGVPIHAVRNTGNVSVLLDIGYAPMMYLEWAPKPGLEQGPGTFITALGRTMADGTYTDVVIPPDGRVKAGNINPDNEIPLRLTYGAPTSLESVATGGQPAAGMGTAYEIRAYGDIIKPIIPYEQEPEPAQ